jgi:serine protease inhibitor
MAGTATIERTFWLKTLLFPLLFCSRGLAQEAALAQPTAFLRSNDGFAMSLLNTVHEKAPDRNIAISPLPVSLSFAAMFDASSDPKSKHEIASAFQWDETVGLSSASRMLLARFEKPKTRPVRHISTSRKQGSADRLYPDPGKPEESWISAVFLYRGQGSLSQDFIDRVKYDFGFDFRAVGEQSSQSEILAKNWDSSLPMPTVTGLNDFWITSFTHLRTSWMGNTFVRAKREKQDFTLRQGKIVQADFLKSELNTYRYVRTEDFEAVVLSCWEASVLFVLPTQGSDIRQLETSLSKDPRLIESLLKSAVGDVELPPFHFTYDSELRNFLEAMGVHRIFNSDPDSLLFMVPGKGGVLRGIVQKTEITVDEEGIRADAGTVMHGIYGGMMSSPPTPFHMALNRPFLFIIRDQVTNSLLFTGAVMNPTLP